MRGCEERSDELRRRVYGISALLPSPPPFLTPTTQPCRIFDMVPPHDGVWCLYVNEVIVRCMGDFPDQTKNFFPDEIIGKVEFR